MVIQLDRVSLLKRVLCLLLIAIVLVMSIGLPFAQAVAAEVAVVAGAKELICAVLIACGFEFARNEDARSVAGKVWDWLGEHSKSVFDAIYKSAQILVATQPGAGAGMRLSTDVFGALKDALISFGFDPAVSGSQSIGIGSFSYKITNPFTDAPILSDFLHKNHYFEFSFTNYGNVWHRKLVFETDDDGVRVLRDYRWKNDETPLVNKSFYETPKLHLDNAHYCSASASDSYNVYIPMGVCFSAADVSVIQSGYDTVSTSDLTFGLAPISVSGSLTYPGDQTLVLAPPMPGVTTGEDGKEIVTYPPMSLNPDDHKKEIPLPPSGLVDDIPYDVPIDATTGEVIDTENPDISGGEDANIFQRFWDWIKGLLQSILDAIKAIVSAIVGFFDSPSDFRLDFDGFKNLILPERFPFCIPFDLVNSVRVFSANAQDFSFRIDFDTKFFSVHHAVDLTPFVLPIAFFRYTCVIWFCWVLITRTRDMIKW